MAAPDGRRSRSNTQPAGLRQAANAGRDYI